MSASPVCLCGFRFFWIPPNPAGVVWSQAGHKVREGWALLLGAAVFDKFNTMPGETFVASSVDAPPAGEAEQRGDLRLGS